MAVAASAIAARELPEVAKQVAAFAAASNLITTTVGTYVTLFLSLPFSNFLYAILEPRIGRFGPARTGRQAVAVGDSEEHRRIDFATLAALLALVGAIALLLGNWIT